MALKIENKAKNSADIWLYGEIGESWSDDYITAAQFAKELQKIGSVKDITLHINSPGGSVFDGLAIYNSLKKHPAHIVTEIDGAALSIASVIALAGDEVRMSGNALYMIHNPWAMTSGDAKEMRSVADRLDMVRDSLLGTYAAKTSGKIDAKEISGMMDAETWLNASDALKYGFVDQITDPIEIAAKYDLSRYHYKNIPVMAKESVAMPQDKALRAMVARMTMKINSRRVSEQAKNNSWEVKNHE